MSMRCDPRDLRRSQRRKQAIDRNGGCRRHWQRCDAHDERSILVPQEFDYFATEPVGRAADVEPGTAWVSGSNAEPAGPRGLSCIAKRLHMLMKDTRGTAR
jgi:hypothetical protein